MAEILTGQLGPVRLASVLQLAESELVTGVLTTEVGTVTLTGGRLIAASCGALHGLHALYELFVREQGPFRIETGSATEGRALGPLLALVIEGCRLSDEWSRLSPLIFRVVDGGVASTDAERALVARLDGKRTLERAIQGPRAPVIDFLLQATEVGALAEVPGGAPSAPTPPTAPSRVAQPSAPPPPPVAPVPVDFDAAMEEGRRQTRQGNWELAIAAFRTALGLQPNDRVAQQNLRRAEQAREGHVDKSAFNWFRRA